MAISKQRKEELVAQYTELIKRSSGMVLTANQGLDMARLDELRAKLRELDAEFHITKNTLVDIALKNEGFAVPREALKGPTAVAFAFTDIAATSKAVLEWAEKSSDEKLTVTGGALDGGYLDRNQIEAVSKLPPLPEVRAKLLGLFNMPAANLVRQLNAPQQQLAGVIGAGTRQLVNVLNAYAQKQDA